jgi:hypothetical protein
VKKRQGLDWVLGMLVLAALDDPDDELVDEIRGGIDYGLDEGPPLIQWLVLLPRKIRVVSPPRIVSLRKWSIGTSTDGTTTNMEWVCSIDGLAYDESINLLSEGIYLHL